MRRIDDSPCYLCPEKHLGCHSNCTHGYPEYRMRREKMRAERLQEANIESGLRDDVIKFTRRRTNKWGGEG